jgi:uncharacterized membrane protein YhaH (DUF805 family)
MFKAPFSFEGRIRRTEYGLSLIISAVVRVIIASIVVGMTSGSSDRSGTFVMSLIFSIPILWFMFAQGAKRCHDVGMTGWLQLIPLFPLYLIFAEGEKGSNKYGEDPKSKPEVTNF